LLLLADMSDASSGETSARGIGRGAAELFAKRATPFAILERGTVAIFVVDDGIRVH